MKDFDLSVENFIKNVVMETTFDMDGDKQLEKQMKALAKNK